MFEDVKEKVELVKDLLKLQERVKMYIPESTWDNVTFDIVQRLLREVVEFFESVEIEGLHMINLSTLIEHLNRVRYLPYLTVAQQDRLQVIIDAAVEEWNNT